LDKLAEILEIDSGALTGNEILDELGWDSLSALSFIVMADEDFDLSIPGSQMKRAASISDLVLIMGDLVKD